MYCYVSLEFRLNLQELQDKEERVKEIALYGGPGYVGI